MRSPDEILSLSLRAVRGSTALAWNAVEMSMIEAGLLSPPARSRLPDFLGIGTPQSGTTWLFDKLVCHPGIFIPERKEMEFFYWERAEIHKRVFGLRSYARHYDGAGPCLKGDLTPNYSVLPGARIRYAHRLMPDAKLILVIRHPVERTWSATRRLLPRYFDRAPSDADSIIGFLEREPWIHEFSDYPAIIDRWLEVYPASALLNLGFEAIQRRPADVLQRTLEHLGLDPDIDLANFELDARVNVNPEMAIPPEVDDYLRSKYAPVLDEMDRRGLMEPE